MPKDGPSNPSNAQKLMLYKYYKQATVGDNKTATPNMLNFESKNKWSAWETVKGTSKEEAEKKYVEVLTEVSPNWRE